MKKENAAPLGDQRKPQKGVDMGPKSMPIVTDLPADVKRLREMSEKRRVPTAEMVTQVKALYPKFDRFLLSRCAHGEVTGVMLRPAAMKALTERFEDGGQKPRAVRRQRPNRCQCRLTDALYEQVQARLRDRGQTMQEYLEELTRKDLTGGEDDGKHDEPF